MKESAVLKKRRPCVPAAVLFMLFAAGGAFASAKKDLSLSVKDRRILGLSSAGLTLAFHMEISNASAVPYSLVRYNYRVTVNQKEYLPMEKVTLDGPIALNSPGPTLLSLPVKFTFDLLFSVVGVIEEKASCDVVGDMFFADDKNKEEKISFAFSGDFPIFKDPEVDCFPVLLKDLTIGGTDLVFGVKFKNDNHFELLVNDIRYKITFADRPVQEGAIPGDKSIPARGEKEFYLPFILDFFEVGPELYEKLGKPEIPCRFEGRIDVMSVWGPLSIRFDRQGSVAVKGPS